MAGKQDPGQDPRRNAGRWRIMLYFNAYVITLPRTVCNYIIPNSDAGSIQYSSWHHLVCITLFRCEEEGEGEKRKKYSTTQL